MKIFLQSIDIELQYIINEDLYKTTILDANTGRFRPKVRNKLSTEEKANLNLNAKAMNVLYNAFRYQ